MFQVSRNREEALGRKDRLKQPTEGREEGLTLEEEIERDNEQEYSDGDETVIFFECRKFHDFTNFFRSRKFIPR